MLCSSAALLLLIGCGDEDSSEPDAGSAVDAMPGAPDAMAGAADATTGAPDAAAVIMVTFDVVHPIFAAKCGPCHTTSGDGGHSIGQATIAAAYADSQSIGAGGVSIGARALIRIQAGTMPQGADCAQNPLGERCVTQAEQDVIQFWLDDGQLGPI